VDGTLATPERNDREATGAGARRFERAVAVLLLVRDAVRAAVRGVVRGASDERGAGSQLGMDGGDADERRSLV
jgi:hypothetical protein